MVVTGWVLGNDKRGEWGEVTNTAPAIWPITTPTRSRARPFHPTHSLQDYLKVRLFDILDTHGDTQSTRPSHAYP